MRNVRDDKDGMDPSSSRRSYSIPTVSDLSGLMVTGGVFMESIGMVGIDLAKHNFHVYAVDGRGRLVVQKQLRRQQMMRGSRSSHRA